MAAKSLHHRLTFIHSLFFVLYVFQAVLATEHDTTFSSKHSQLLSHDVDGDDCYALFQFKQSISIDESASSSYLRDCEKIASWKLNNRSRSGSSDYCCLWDGVDCNDKGHVVSLDLSSSCLNGPINSTTTLFSLVCLRSLNLANNYFMVSSIPPEIGHLSQLTTLNLSYSGLSGQIPKEVLQLTQLASLDLSGNYNLKLKSPSFSNLVQNITGLEELFLSEVDISAEVPDVLANFSSLRSVYLSYCGLTDEFPAGIFRLPKLRYLNVEHNKNLNGHIPEFHQSSLLEHLMLAYTNLSGKLPASIGNFKSLVELDLGGCSFTGSPPSLANLSQLTSLSFRKNAFDSWQLPNWIGKLGKLNYLDLYDTSLDGEIPTCLANLTQLRHLNLGYNHLTGRIPSFLFNLTQLTLLGLSHNQLQGPIPRPFSNLNSLKFLDLANNHIHGTVDGNIFLNLKKLMYLNLGQNNIWFVVTNNYTNATLPMFQVLSLGSCHLTAFPDFLRFQDQLTVLNLEHNGIEGQVPEWICNTSTKSLLVLKLSHNKLQGNLPVPPPNAMVYDVSNNRLTGEIPPWICQLVSLEVMHISNNNMTGNIPPCLGNMSSLIVLNLNANSFNGSIPNAYTLGSMLELIDFSDNQLQWQVPKSLVNCSMLQYLDLGRNRLYDMFPFWLGGLSELQVLILRSNKFHGQIESSIAINSTFLKLHVFDISANMFTGNLPREYFQSWIAMMSNDEDREFLEIGEPIGLTFNNFAYSLVVTNKGLRLEYMHISEHLKIIDLSSNQFRGEIPESIGNLQGLVVLNVSHNQLVGAIPSSIANLTLLESLDLSQNILSGLIPQELVQLNFLESFNVSCNDLAGPIPQGNHLNTFPDDSFAGNQGLCGLPLSKRCGNPPPATPTPPLPSITYGGADSYEFPSGVVDWIVISSGFTSGLVIGIIIGQYLTTKHHEWFLETFGKRKMGNRQGGRTRRGRARK